MAVVCEICMWEREVKTKRRKMEGGARRLAREAKRARAASTDACPTCLSHIFW